MLFVAMWMPLRCVESFFILCVALELYCVGVGDVIVCLL